MSETAALSPPTPDNDTDGDAKVVAISGTTAPRGQTGSAPPESGKAADPVWLGEARKEAARIEYDCQFHAEAQFEACARWARWSTALGFVSAVLGALTASAVASVLGDAGLGVGAQTAAETAARSQNDWPTVLKLCIAFGALFAGVVAAAVRFLDPQGRTAQHGAAGKRYRALADEARQFRNLEATADAARDNLFHHLQTMIRHRAEIHEAAPVVPKKAVAATRAKAKNDAVLVGLAEKAGRGAPA